jgi:hypothetical protein
MMGNIYAPLVAAPAGGIAYSVASRGNAIGESLSFALSFAVIFLVLLLDCMFRKLGG